MAEPLRAGGLAARRTAGETHAQVGGAVDADSVVPQRGFGHGQDGAVVGALDAGDLDLGGDLFVGWHYLAAVSPRHRFVQRHRLEARRRSHLPAQPEIEHPELQELKQHLDAQRSGLHGIPVEVRLEEPLVGVDVLDGAPPAQTGAAVGGPAAGHPVHHQQHRVGQPGAGTEEFVGLGAQVDDRRRAGELQQSALFVADRETHLLLQRFETEVSEHRVVGVDGSVVIGDFTVEGHDDRSARRRDVLELWP